MRTSVPPRIMPVRDLITIGTTGVRNFQMSPDVRTPRIVLLWESNCLDI